jgi:zinc transport system permease protein
MPDFLQYDFFVRALVAGVLIGYLASNLGVFVILRKMSFFSEAISHSSLTGIALGLLLGVNPLLGAVGFSVVVALAVSSLAKRRGVSIDTVIGVLFSTAMALGVIVIGLLKGYRVDLFGYLFGDILGVSRSDITLIVLLTVTTIVALFLFFRVWAKIAFHSDLAKVEGVNVELHDRVFVCILALVVALGLKIVGAVLIGPLVIIPAAAAKNVSWNFRSMFVVSSLIGILSSALGLVVSYYANTASGPTIVLVAAAFFALSFLARPKTGAA